MSAYYGGYRGKSTAGRAPNPAHNRQSPSLKGSDRVYCYGCEQEKPRLAFTETQLKKAGNLNPAKKHHIMCKTCTPEQPSKLKCNVCSKSLSLEKFSKTQRKRQEKATCKDCREMIDDDDSEADYDMEDDPDYFEGDIKDIL
ncbi:hypothetical protein BX616_008344 [Lobosporangium transversale]|uniref:Stc1 domain-containing protein n=1 Tax=Lobosporangium transversale TaxID=64571 RepID=A0A1Y2GLX8_9FUNG|nr:hypothetical protein BCR41DRAFT_386757 [Lobosporangium transversale]KAF9918499.1 hypothetical protein BX616_008344 [Lobosporangium transversale]ORZ14912.1 hypothetical protein BCR41DRAFT_386757 [Lobosporangium transversale]|eukprot:XP_021881044.1 hypothetical protein BCR41DRAFT_386757 [Lobosporangium transversale]